MLLAERPVCIIWVYRLGGIPVCVTKLVYHPQGYKKSFSVLHM